MAIGAEFQSQCSTGASRAAHDLFVKRAHQRQLSGAGGGQIGTKFVELSGVLQTKAFGNLYQCHARVAAAEQCRHFLPCCQRPKPHIH